MWKNGEKYIAIRQLVVNLGDIQKTHEETGVPVRTLQRWKTDLTMSGDTIFWDQDTRAQVIHARYERLRDSMLFEVQRLLNMSYEVPPAESPNFVMAATRLVDRLSKIESVLQGAGQYGIIVKYEPPEESPEQRLSEDK